MVINTNIQAQSAATTLSKSQSLLSKSLARLSSGSKIADPADDAGGFAVAARLDSQVKRLNAARNNVSGAISFTQTQDGFLQRVTKALDRMSELSMLAQDVTKSLSDLRLYNEEFQTMMQYLNDIRFKQFNGVTLFSSTTLSVTTDADPGPGNVYDMSGIDLATTFFSIVAGTTIASSGITLSILSATLAASALTDIKNAFGELAADRAKLGANQTRLSHTLDQLQVTKENLMAASSRIQDVDVAEETTQFARYNILVQAGTAMLAQANTLPQSVLRLLQ